MSWKHERLSTAQGSLINDVSLWKGGIRGLMTTDLLTSGFSDKSFTSFKTWHWNVRGKQSRNIRDVIYRWPLVPVFAKEDPLSKMAKFCLRFWDYFSFAHEMFVEKKVWKRRERERERLWDLFVTTAAFMWPASKWSAFASHSTIGLIQEPIL